MYPRRNERDERDGFADGLMTFYHHYGVLFLSTYIRGGVLLGFLLLEAFIVGCSNESCITYPLFCRYPAMCYQSGMDKMLLQSPYRTSHALNSFAPIASPLLATLSILSPPLSRKIESSEATAKSHHSATGPNWQRLPVKAECL